MSEVKLVEHIVATAGVRGGRPRVAGTRLTVSEIVAALGAGDSIEELIEDFPELSREGIYAALRYAAESVDHPVIIATAAE